MNVLTPEEFNELSASERKFAYKLLYENWQSKGGKIRQFRDDQDSQTQDRVRGAHESNLNNGVTPVNKYIIRTWWKSMHDGKYLSEKKLTELQENKFKGEKSRSLKKGTVRNWLTSMNYVWNLYSWHSDQLEQFDADVRTHKNPRTRLLIP